MWLAGFEKRMEVISKLYFVFQSLLQVHLCNQNLSQRCKTKFCASYITFVSISASGNIDRGDRHRFGG